MLEIKSSSLRSLIEIHLATPSYVITGTNPNAKKVLLDQVDPEDRAGLKKLLSANSRFLPATDTAIGTARSFVNQFKKDIVAGDPKRGYRGLAKTGRPNTYLCRVQDFDRFEEIFNAAKVSIDKCNAEIRRNWERAPNTPKMYILTLHDHRNPLRPKIQLRAAAHEFCQSSPELARAQMHLKRKFLHKVYVRLVWPKYRYRRGAIGPGYLLVPLVWSGGTRRPHIGLGPQINFHPHFRSKIGIVKKHPENPLLAPKHVAGVYKHHGTLKLCSEALTSLLQGGFWSFMRLNLAS